MALNQNQLINFYSSTGTANSTPSMILPGSNIPTAVVPTTQTLPNSGGTFNAGGKSTITPTSIFTGAKPVQTAPKRNFYKSGGSYYYADTNQKILNPTELQVAAKSGAEVAPPVGVQDNFYDKYKDPNTGKIMTPEEWGVYLGNKVPKGTGEITNYAGDAVANPNQTAAELTNRARDLNNSRNDIATGTTDPYKIASQSGIPYSGAELAAIEKAYAGIYDPALKDVFTRLKDKQDADAKEAAAKVEADKAATAQKNKLAEMAQQHEYDMELKQTLSGSDRASLSSGSGGGGYVVGQDPVADAWIDRISRGEATMADIKGVANQGLRDKVSIGLNTSKARNAMANGNLDAMNVANQLLLNPELDNISGLADQFIGGLWGDAKLAKTQFDQLKGILQLAKAQSFKGQGQISDYERKILSEAATAMNRGLSDAAFKEQLIKTRGVFANTSGLSTPVKITDPSTGESDIQSLNTEEINKFLMDGAIVTYVQGQ